MEDISGSFSTPDARDDTDILSAGSHGPATGNVITGAGTTSGKAGADIAAGGHVVAARGAGGSDASDSGSSLHVEGRYGVLTLDANGNYRYTANQGAPDNVRDLFQYTLANAKGGRDTADLVIELGGGAIKVDANAQRIVPGADGLITLPPGVDLTDVHVVGRDLVVNLPNGQQLIIVDGAVFVPQLVIGGVEVPASNVAELLIDSEIKPTAGPPQSSGGNFADPLSPLDPGSPLGDLIPPTELVFQPPEVEEIGQFLKKDEPTTLVIETPDQPEGAINATESVNEKGLPVRTGASEGSGEAAAAGANDDTSETNTGTIVFTTPDGFGSVSINGTVVTGNGQQIAGQFGTITITAYNPGAGTIGYSYTLSVNTSGDATQDVFAVVATDQDGDTSAASLTVHIIDDVPTARNDSGAQATQDASVIVNVINNDTPGADSVNLTSGVAFVTGSLQVSAGQTAGSVVYNNNGTFTYIPSPGQEGSVTFQYRITDGDGDTSVATVTITLLPDAVPTISVTGDQSVNEAGLPARGSESEGSGEAAAGGVNGDTSETAIGTINVNTGNDTVGSLIINGVNVTNGGVVNGAHGTLTVTLSGGVYSYSYTLTDNSSGDATNDTFSVTVTDNDGDSANTSLVISIVDDVPTAHNDSGTQASPDASVTVNVIANDVPGADSVNLTSGVAFVAGSLQVSAGQTAGSVVYNNNGTFTYIPSPGQEGSVTFQYKITDGDGDTSIATVTITLLADSVPTVGISGDQSVDEAGLPARGSESEGSGEAAAAGANGDTSETAVGNINITTGSDTVGSLIVGGVDVTNGGVVNGVNGTLTVTFSAGVYSYSYTLNDNTSGDATSDTFSVKVTDSDGDTATTSLVISIVDDVPTAHDDSGSQSVEGAPVTVNVINNDVPGADSVNLTSGVALVAGSLSGTGSVLYNSDGTFTYTPGAGEEGTVTFQYKITDGDGDTSIATVTITLAADSTPTVGVTGDQSVNEAGLPARGSESEGSGEAAAGGVNGDTTETAVGNINITTGGDTLASLIINNVNVTGGGTVNGVNGVLTVTFSAGVYSYSYTLSDNTSGDATSDTFSVKVTDSDGDTATTSLVISIVDDVPTAHNDSGTQLSENASITVNVINNDVPGADSVSLTTGVALVPLSLTGTGSVLYNNDGTFTYTPGAGEEGTVTFQYKITDGDGDTSIATVTITLLADSTPTVGVSGDQSVNEAGLPARGSESEGSGEAAAGGVNGDTTETAVGNINITTGNDTVQSLVINNVNVTGGGTVNGVNGVLTVTFSAGVYSYSYTLSDNTSGDATSDTFSVKVTDSDGDTATTSLVISIVDDVPTARNDSGSQTTEDAPITVNVINNDTPGADSVSLTTGVALVAGSLTGTGSVLYNNNGTFTYTPTAGEQGTVTFQYKITDGDGDTSIATVTITLLGDSTPTVGVTGDQSVNEAGLPARGSEPEGSGEAAAAGANGDTTETAVGNINITTGNDTLASLIINNVNVTGGGTVNGVNGVLTVTFSAGVYSYSYTLSDNTSGDATSDTFSVKVTDSDGDTATTSLVIGIVDDVPTAHNDTDSIAAGGTSATGNVITGVGTTSSPGGIDVVGADNATVVSITGAGGTDTTFNAGLLDIVGTYGTLHMDANGNYTYDRNAGSPGGVTDTFSYKLQDGDGDTSSATLIISIGDATPIATSGTAAVDDDGLAGGNPASTTGDLDANAGEAAPVNPSEAIFHGQLVASGGDTITSYSFASMNGTTGTVGTETVNYTWNAGTNTLTATGPRGVLFTVVVNPTTGSYDLTLVDNVLHTAGGDENDASTALTFTVADTDGDTATSTITVTFDDDAPTAVSAAAITSGLSNGGGDSASANLDGGAGGNSIVADNFGADGGKVIFTAATITALQGQNLTHNLADLSYVISADGQTLTGYVDSNTNSTVDAGETVFTIQLQTGSGNDYTVTMVQSVDTLQTIDFNGGGYNFVGGNGSWAGFTSGTNGDGIIDLLLTPMVNGVNSSTMNTNANEGGVGSGNSVSFGEGVRIDTVQDLQAVPAPTPSGDYGILANENHVFGQHQNVLGISAVISTVGGAPGSTTDIQLIARDESVASDSNDLVGDGTIEAITQVVITHGADTETVLKSDGLVQIVNVDGQNVTVTFGATDATVAGIVEGTRVGAFTADGYDSLEIRNVGGETFKIGDFNTLSVSNGPLDLTAPISVVDGDGDTVASGNLAIHIDASAPPVVLDLNGDGVHFLGTDAGVLYDYGNGLVATAWAAPDDGILVHDANHNGTVDDASEFVFGSGSITDLQALAAYDTNHDGQLSSADADFASFAVWQDANSNGVVDAGEMSSLTARGIASISLSSDGIAYSAANGDVAVAGTGSFTYANGSTGALADAAFLTDGRGVQARSISASDGNAAILAAAVAAAGLAANAASAAGNHANGQASSNAASGAAVHNQALAPEALDLSGAQGSSFVQQGTVTAQAAIAASSQSNASDQGQSHSAANSAVAQSQAPTDLLQGTDAPVHNAVVSATPVAAASVGMPAPAQAGGVADGGPAQSNAVVAQVLADALHGGAGGPLDALINSLPGHGGGSAADALASHNAGGVSNGDTGVFAAFSAAHMGLTMESMVVHQDAAPHA